MVNSESLIHPIILFDSSTTRIRAIETHLSEHFDIIPFYNIKTTLALLDMLGKHHNIVNPLVRTVLALTDCFVEYNPIRQKHEFLSLDFFLFKYIQMCNLQSEGRLSLSKPVNLVIPADLFSEWDKDIASNILKKNEVLPQVVQRNGIMNLLHKLN